MGSPLVSILIPNYNKAPYIRGTLDSVLAQTYIKWECIIVDDHSTDDSWDILKEYAQKDSRFRIFKRPNNLMPGGNASRNYAMENAKGTYLFFLDSDDLYNENRLTNSVKFLIQNKVSAVYSGAWVRYNDRNEIISSREFMENETAIEFLLFNGGWAPTPTFIIHQDIARKVKFDEFLKRHQDYDFFIKVSNFTKWVFYNSYDVIVNWSRQDYYKLNYDDCIMFYEKYFDHLDQNKIDYMINFAKKVARFSPDSKILLYFHEKIVSSRYPLKLKYRILFKCPHVFFLLAKLKSRITA